MHHIYLCERNSKIFMARTYSSHPWLWPAYIKGRFAFPRTVEIMLTFKEVWDRVCSPKIDFLTSTVPWICLCLSIQLYPYCFWVYHVLNHSIFRRRSGRYFSHYQAKCEREIFTRRAMVDQAQECLRYQRKILNILEVLNIEKLTRSVFWLFLIVNCVICFL